MVRGKTILLVVMAAVTALALTGVATSQTSRPAKGPGGPWGGGDPNSPEYKAAMEKYRQQMSKMNQDMLGATDDEWKVLQPKFDKVADIQQQIMMAAYVVYWPAASTQPDDAKQSDLQKTAAALAKLLKNKDVKPEDVKQALEAYRNAKAKANEDLAKARKELKELLTVKQEANLVLRGMLD